MNHIYGYFHKVFHTVQPVWVFLWAGFCWMAFPDAVYVPAIIAVWIAVGLDLVTRLMANSINHGGFLKAARCRSITSDTLFRKTAIKVVSYLIIQVLAGLSMRVVYLKSVSIALATVVYSFLFIRESTSIVEHLIEAGCEQLRPLLFWLKKKEHDITDD